MKRWQMALLAPLLVAAFFIGRWVGLVQAAPPAPSQVLYLATVLLPSQTINCAAGLNALTFTQSAITVDCSADRIFQSGFQQ